MCIFTVFLLFHPSLSHSVQLKIRPGFCFVVIGQLVVLLSFFFQIVRMTSSNLCSRVVINNVHLTVDFLNHLFSVPFYELNMFKIMCVYVNYQFFCKNYSYIFSLYIMCLFSKNFFNVMKCWIFYRHLYV